ncbi:hypothetical protein A1O7_05966 [Cladophialophora yegresii CBS 114405]|uniref:CCZ1/INTU/HSP4 first Longin domain-containing protein n=1 Tax=Cladophialophora yegresii CBS 114405 TaxID=1182544 RepID=W9WJ67_9EURO|nr:uncharacterized protein A1O7_05966 [Cladophialophora yegresii CBS 114405]EXJ58539.1 hypothetical protein A1O7_05966 [Cladophialophora yegresii CBS 114405]
MSAPIVTPAHLSYLAIYNPSLGSSDEALRDQIVFYYSHKLEAEIEHHTREKDATKREDVSSPERDAAEKKEAIENERLRQVGLAQGMVNFAKNFSNSGSLESVDTEKSRVVLKEVEPGWWILAAIDLTQLPAANRVSAAASSSAKSGRNTPASEASSSRNIEYSSREVAPAPLLLAQLLQAHRIFLLHHASSLSELWKKHGVKREVFCSLLHRYWTRFIWNWDILLHGNPAVDLYDSIKLASGGELGVGVGEEEWGSGEREVLEGFAARNEGLVDLVVGRYGDVSSSAGHQPTNASHTGKDSSLWLGNGDNSRAEDGIIFSGIGGISRRCLTTVSQWMESVYMCGDAAYGIGENPSSRPRNRRRRREIGEEGAQKLTSRRAETLHAASKSPALKVTDLRRKVIEKSATPPGIPPPLVSAVEASLDNAIAKADANASSWEDRDRGQSTTGPSPQTTEQASMFNPEKMMRYLSLGYGSSWTLNPKGFNADGPSATLGDKNSKSSKGGIENREAPIEAQLRELDPTPEVSDDEGTPFVQRLEESIGKFLVGLSGDLENTEFEDESNDEGTTDATPEIPAQRAEAPRRVVLRTLTVEMSTARFSRRVGAEQQSSQPGRGIPESDSSKGKTSAAASADGAQPVVTHEKLQVVVYVHQPFIFVFLFQLHTSNLTIPAFYRGIHHTLGPLQKSLLRSTDPERWRQRMREGLGIDSGSLAQDSSSAPPLPDLKDVNEMFDLLYDPAKSTIRTSIPNIPLPGSLAAEGLHRSPQNARPITVSGSWYTLGIPIGSSSAANGANSPGAAALVKSHWTRIEALNVYTQILSTWAASRDKQVGLKDARPHSEELERTIKTSRSWWIVWTKISTSDEMSCPTSKNCAKEAILVRRAPQDGPASSREPSRSRSEARMVSSAGRWLLREQPRSREVSGVSGGSAMSSPGAANAKGVTEGVGVDAKRWVEALVRLST